jgi:lysophospholipase L1-like esterase
MSIPLSQTPTLVARQEPSGYIPATKRGASTLASSEARALSQFHAALSDVNNNPVKVAHLGHSMVAGFTTTRTLDRYATSSITALRNRLGLPAGGIGYMKAINDVGLGDYPIVNTGTVLSVSDVGWGSSGGVHLGTGFVTQQTINVPAGHTSVDIIWSGNASYGTFQWSLDGGSNTSVATTTGNHWATTRITVTPGTTHAIVITPVSGTCRMGGAMFYAGDEANGIQGFVGGQPSSNSADWVQKVINPNNRGWLDAVAANQPSLIVFTVLCNDYISYNQAAGVNNVQPEAVKANLRQVMNIIAAKCTVRPSVVLCIENQRNNIDASLGPSHWADYVNAAYDLADSEGWAVFDWWKRIGNMSAPQAVTAGWLNADTIHPSTKGHRFWGESLATFLMPR